MKPKTVHKDKQQQEVRLVESGPDQVTFVAVDRHESAILFLTKKQLARLASETLKWLDK